MFTDEWRKQLIELICKNSDATLNEVPAHFGKQCFLNAVHKLVTALGFVFKKILKAKEQRREHIVCAR